jgi:hypothetical protein
MSPTSDARFNPILESDENEEDENGAVEFRGIESEKEEKNRGRSRGQHQIKTLLSETQDFSFLGTTMAELVGFYCWRVSVNKFTPEEDRSMLFWICLNTTFDFSK